MSVEFFERFAYWVRNEEGEVIAMCMFYEQAKMIVKGAEISGNTFWIDKV